MGVAVKGTGRNFIREYSEPRRGGRSHLRLSLPVSALEGRENEPPARWKELGVEGRGGVIPQSRDGCVDLGPTFSLVIASGSCDPEPWLFIAGELGRGGTQVWLWLNLPHTSWLEASSHDGSYV